MNNLRIGKVKLLFIGLLLLSVESYSQIVDRITVNTGVSSSNLKWVYEGDAASFYPDMQYPSLLGYFNKVDLEYFEYKHYNLTTGFGFYQKGSQFINRAYELHLNYLTFDAMLKLKYKIKKVLPHFVVGPRFDYLVNHSKEFNEFDQLATLYKNNYGLRYGVGIQYDFGKFDLGLGWQNNFNFNSVVVNKGEKIWPEFEIEDKTRVFFLNLALKLREE